MIQFFISNQSIILNLVVAVILGLFVGGERLFVHKDAGMKTHALVSLGAALFVVISNKLIPMYLHLPGFNPTMIPAQIIVGIGFLGAGSIMVYGSRLRGLTTAGGLWVMAGIGMAAGFGFFSMAVIATLLVLMILVLVNILEKPIRKYTEEIDNPKV